MTNNHLVKDLSFSTLLSLDYGTSFGSGFRLHHEESGYLVTAKHVLFDKDGKLRSKILTTTSQNIRGIEIEAKILDIELETAILFHNEKEDVVVILIEKKNIPMEYVHVIQEGSLKTSYIDSSMTRTYENIGVANDVILVGYPTSLIFQDNMEFDVRKPLLRKGIIAGINDKSDNFIIDCPSYYGNSGGAIIEVGEDGVYRLIGIVSRYIPFVVTWKNNREPGIVNTEFSNSGYSVCIPIDSVFNLIDNTKN